MFVTFCVERNNTPTSRNISKERHFVYCFPALRLVDAAEHDGLTIVDQDLGFN